MAESKAAGHVRGPDEVEPEEHVQRVEHGGNVAIGDRGDQLGFERIARDGGRLQREPSRRGDREQLLLDRGDDRTRDGFGQRLGTRSLLDSRRVAGPRQLFHVEGIAAAFAIQLCARPLVDACADQPLGLLRG